MLFFLFFAAINMIFLFVRIISGEKFNPLIINEKDLMLVIYIAVDLSIFCRHIIFQPKINFKTVKRKKKSHLNNIGFFRPLLASFLFLNFLMWEDFKRVWNFCLIFIKVVEDLNISEKTKKFQQFFQLRLHKKSEKWQ